MSLPVNLGDAIALLEQIRKAYDAYKNTPDKVRQALKKFEDTEKECKALNAILATSRIPELRSWPGTEELVTDLESAHAYLNNYRPLAEGGTTRMTRVKKTTLLQWKWADFEKNIAIVDRHRENIKDFKQTVLIRTTQANIELSISAIKLHMMNQSAASRNPRGYVYDDTISTTSDSDHISLLSKVSRSLQVAGSLESAPHQHRRLPLSPVLESSASRRSVADESPEDLKGNIARFIERRHLNMLDAVQDARQEDLEYIARLPEKWYRSQIRPDIQPASAIRTSINSIGSRSSSESEAVVIHSIELPVAEPSDDALSLSPSWHKILNQIQYDQSSAQSAATKKEFLPDPAIDLEVSSLSDVSSIHTEEQVDDQAMVIDQVMIAVPWIKASLPCQLRLTRSEGSLCIRASTTKTFNPDRMPAIGGQTPSTLLNLRPAQTNASEPIPLVFSHAVLGGMSSFPKILHPTAEVGDSGEYPYVVEFYDHQYLKAEGYPNLRPAVQGLRYLFQRKSDRDLLRQEIFGKELLASVGVSGVQFDTSSKSVPKPCTTQAATLWRVHRKNEGSIDVPELTITIQCSTKGKQTEPDCAREFSVVRYDAKKLEKVRKSEGKEIELEIRPVAEKDTPSTLPSPELSGTVQSSGSTASNVSTYSTGSDSRYDPGHSTGNRSRKTSFLSMKRNSSIITVETIKPVKPFLCYIRFTESSPSLIRAKERFADALKDNMPRNPG